MGDPHFTKSCAPRQPFPAALLNPNGVGRRGIAVRARASIGGHGLRTTVPGSEDQDCCNRITRRNDPLPCCFLTAGPGSLTDVLQERFNGTFYMLERVLLLTLVAVAILLGGCGPSAQVRTTSLVLAPPGSQTGRLVVLRESQFQGGGVTVPVAIDGKPVADLGSGNFVQFDVVPGQHFVGVGFEGRLQIARVQLAASSTKFFRFHFDLWNKASDNIDILEQLTDEEGQRLIASGQYKQLLPEH